MTSLIGKQIDNYRVDALLGEGGMGSVYRAHDLNLARPVALKIMHNQFANQPEFRQRFLQEAQAAARLGDHPSIVNIYNFDNRHDLFFMVMEFVPGASLGAYIERVREQNQVVKLSETLLILAQVAEALGYAHRQGVIHRDVKPDNVLLKPLDEPDREGDLPVRAVVTDFGLAKLLEGGVQTQTGTFMGTLPYMSPEQCMDKELDGRSDIYSLGIMLFQLATGQLPFDIKSPTDAVLKHINEQPPEPRMIRPGVPVAVEEDIKKSIAKNPSERFQTGEEMAAKLRETAAGLTVTDVTLFAPATTVVSLTTRLLPADSAAEPSRLSQDFPATGQDTVIIARRGQEPRTHALDKEKVTIGRSSNNDIVLKDEGVSRKHAQLLKSPTGEWRVVDLGSTNGTTLVNRALTANSPEVWRTGQTLSIGPYFLRLQQIGVAAVEPSPRGPIRSDKGTLKVKPVERYSADMRPKRLRTGGICRVLVRNEGNVETDFTLVGRDLANAIRFDQPSIALKLAPGAKGTADFRPEAKTRPLLGATKALPFEIQVSSASGVKQTLEGNLEVRPFLPIWLVPLFGIMAMVLCLAAFAFYSFADSRNQAATETAESLSSEEVAVQLTQEAVETVSARETGQADEAAAGTATALAATARARGDDDGDGLSNSRELDEGTDPANPDTDGDGLFDGQEVNQHGTDPLQPDSDGDGLTDGAEVNEHGSSPNNPDTDGDGTPDGVEVSNGTDPALPPTATTLPTQTATSTLTPTSTPSATPTTTHTPTSTATETSSPTAISTSTPTETTTPTPTLSAEFHITFETIPDGTPIGAGVILTGNEFVSEGILLAGAPESPYCSDATSAAVRLPGTYNGVDFHFLTTASPSDINRCNAIPVEISFINPVNEVTLTFAGASVTYALKAYDDADVLLGTVNKDAVLNGGTFDITFTSGINNIRRLTFGHETAVTAVRDVFYRQ